MRKHQKVMESSKFMQNHGFYLALEDKTDPDLPWHTFVSNPLWKELKQAKQHEAELNKQLDTQRQQLAEQAKQAEQREAELKSKSETQQQQQAAQAKQAEQREAELKSKLEKLSSNSKWHRLNKQSSAKQS